MPSVNSGILLIGPWDKEYQQIGCDIARDLYMAKLAIKEGHHSVLALSITHIISKDFHDFFQTVKSKNKFAQLIVVIPKDYDFKKVTDLHNKYIFFRVLDGFSDLNLEKFLYEAIEETQNLKQKEYLSMLILEQTAQLKRLQSELEARVEKRTKHLLEARSKAYTTNFRVEAFKKILITVHQATSIAEIEKTLVEALSSVINISWIRILFVPQSTEFLKQMNSEKLDFEKVSIDLFRHHQKLGSIYFMRAPHLKFLKTEIDFLNRVAEVVSIAIQRLNKLKEAEHIKEQWESTFNAIRDPVIIVNESFVVLQSNNVLKKNGLCYEMLFNYKKPCADCNRGKNFQIDINKPQKKIITVNSQKLHFSEEPEPIYVNVYHDVTSLMEMEEKLIEFTKLGELGTISSSIAHELNNPIGGILNFAQLIKMELTPSHSIFEDIEEIERGAIRCKEIVQNLLNYSRSSIDEKKSSTDLNEACLMALKVLEFITRPRNIQIQFSPLQENAQVVGHINLISQAIKNLLKYFFETNTGNFFQILLTPTKNSVILSISCLDSKNKKLNIPVSLSLSIAKQILLENKSPVSWDNPEHPEILAQINFKRVLPQIK